MSAMKSNLPHSKIMKLIEQVKKRPFIWNTKHDMYNDRFLVATGWKEIEEELQHPESSLRLKWRNIRDVFKKEIKKHQCNSIEEYTGKWQYFKAVFFIHTENQAGDNDESVSEQDMNEEYIEEEFSLDDHEELFVAEENDVKIELNPEETDNLKLVNNTEEKLTENNLRKNYAHDYDLMFLRSLVPYFSYLDPMRKLVLRSKLQDILHKELAEQERCNAKRN